MRRPLSLLAALAAPLACSSSEGPTAPPAGTTAAADGGGTSSSEAGNAPLGPLPALWGAAVLADTNPDPRIVEVSLTAQAAKAMVNGKEIDVLAYNGTVPGPILQAHAGDRVIVHFTNALAEPTTVHWHGLRVPESMDGSPRIQTPVAPGASFTYEFVAPDAGSFWYHPHVNTHDQLERGLYGAITIHGAAEPSYDRERSLILDDVLLAPDGTIAPVSLGGMTAMMGRLGNAMLSNGKTPSDVTDKARKGTVERWRIVNAANARRLSLLLEGATGRLIGTDGGLLEAPLPLPSPFVVPVGGRLEVEVSYDKPGAARLVSYAMGSTTPPEKTTMFEVAVEDSADAPRAIEWPKITPPVPARAATSDFAMRFDFTQGASGSEWRINGQAAPTDPILSVPVGATVKIRLENGTGGVEHPFHLHGQFFRVLDPAWPGVRDSVQVPATGPLDIVAYFDNAGRWMAHCHILEHAAVGMMAEIQVGPPSGADAGMSGMGH